MNIFFSCDHNQYSIEYIIALSKAKRKQQSDSSEDTGQGHTISEDIAQGHTDSDESDREFMETLRSEYQSEPMSDSESNSSFSVDATWNCQIYIFKYILKEIMCFIIIDKKVFFICYANAMKWQKGI